MKKTIPKYLTALMLVSMILILPQNILAADNNEEITKNNNCKNSYIRNVQPGANTKLNSLKYFTFELTKDTNPDSVKLSINEIPQKVNVIKKANGSGYLALVKATSESNQKGLILLKISADGSNKYSCNQNLLVGLENTKTMTSYHKPKTSSSYHPTTSSSITTSPTTTSLNISKQNLEENNILSEKIITTKNIENNESDDSINLEDDSESSQLTINDIINKNNNQTATINNANQNNSSNIFPWLITFLIIIFLWLLFKPDSKKDNSI